MANVHDVARYILKHQGPVSAMKLEKLVYYCQAWSLVWDDRPLFAERIEAWVSGPVCPVLYQRHRGEFLIDDWPSGDTSELDKDARETIDVVVDFYGKQSAQWLSDLTHREDPWRKARERAHAAPGERCSEEITLADMAEYYSSL